VYLKEEEAGKLLDGEHFGEGFRGLTDRLICDLLYHTGMRRQELVDLEEGAVEWSLKQLRVLGKGNKERLIPLGEGILEDMRQYIAAKRRELATESKRLLVLESGEPLYAGYVYRVVKKHIGLVATQQKKSPHVMRHTFATHLLNNGANIQAIKDLLGHSSLAATQVYTHNNIEKLKEIHKRTHPREQGPVKGNPDAQDLHDES
jgi:integrase/recombinase XerC